MDNIIVLVFFIIFCRLYLIVMF